MRSLLLAAAIIAIPSAAHAMGVYVDIHVVAWNADGTAALLTRNSSSSGTVGKTQQFVLVGVGDKAAQGFTFDDTQDPDQPTQQVDAAACAKDAATLTKALAARHFKGVKVRADHCKSDRAVVTVTAAETRRATASKVADLTAPKAKAVHDAIVQALGALPDGDDNEYFSASGKLIVAGTGGLDDGGFHQQVEIIDASTSPAKVAVENLR